MFAALLAACCLAADPVWTDFEGPRRDNRSDDVGLLHAWPEGGPPWAWKAGGLGHGYASVVLGGGRIYTAGNAEEKTIVTALDLAGRIVWRAENGPAYDKQYSGSRGTPTLHGDRLVHLSGNGDLTCFESATGKPVWRRNLVRDFDGRSPQWGYAESPLIDAGRVVCSPGGEKTAMVALDLRDGAVVWECRAAGDPPAYASPILVDHGGLRQVVTMTADSVIGVAADTGRFLWRYEREAPYDVNAATPVHRDGKLAIFTTWGRGATQLRLLVEGVDCRVEKAWHNPEFDVEHGGVVLLENTLYGCADGNHKKRLWAAVDWETGRTCYTADGPAGRSGTLTYADGMLYLVGERGEVSLQRAAPAKFEIAGRFQLPNGGDGPVWARPVVCGGRLYLRHGEALFAYDVRAPQ